MKNWTNREKSDLALRRGGNSEWVWNTDKNI